MTRRRVWARCRCTLTPQTPPRPPQAPSHVYGGHGSHVTNVRFTHDDGHLVSLGGKDTGVFQWRVLGGPSPEPR